VLGLTVTFSMSGSLNLPYLVKKETVSFDSTVPAWPMLHRITHALARADMGLGRVKKTFHTA
jgi:hypothetical protein